MKSKILLGSLIAACAMLTACSDDEVNINDLPYQPQPETQAASTKLVYEANPRFFGTSDCLNAIDARLPEIKAEGADILWIMPIQTPGEEKSIGSPYCIRDFKGLNPKYGTMADLKKLVNDAHANGMIVILDWIANHTAWDCDWAKNNPEWYTRDFAGNILSPEGWSDVADLNYDNADMRAAMIDAMIYWLNEAGLDGFRCDHADGVPEDFWYEAISAIRAAKPDAFMLAESAKFSLFDAGFDMIYDWSYGIDIQKYMQGGKFSELVRTANDQLAKVPEGKLLLRYALNHDVLAENNPATIFGAADAILPAQVITYFMGGVPMIYSGVEAGLDKQTSFFTYNPVTWNPELEAKYDAIGAAYKKTAKARGGKAVGYNSGKCAVFSCVNGDASVLVMVNPTGKDASVKVPINFARTAMSDALTDEVVTLPASIDLPAYGYAIFYK